MSSPKLRFKEFSEDWKHAKVENHYYNLPTNSFSRSCLNYEFGSVKNIHYGDIHVKFKSHFDVKNETVPFINEDVNYKRYGNESYCLEKDLVFADASEDLNDIGKCIEIVSTNSENILCGLHTIHLRNINNNLFKGFSGFLFRTENVVKQIQKESQGAKVLGISSRKILNININLPTLKEQEKITTFFTTIDHKLNLLKEKKEKLELYKKGVMQQIFSQKLRFKDVQGNEFPGWELYQLNDILSEHKTRNKDNQVKEVFSVAKNKGVINQIEHLGRSYASKDVTNYKVSFPDDLIYTKSPTSDFPFGIIKQNKTGRTGIVSTLYGVFKPKTKYIGFILDYYFSTWENTFNYLNPLVEKGAKNTMNINNDRFLNGVVISLPSDEFEQQKITNFIKTLDAKISLVETQIHKTALWKKGLLQQMFV